jgi:ribosome biogenesis GTPase
LNTEPTTSLPTESTPSGATPLAEGLIVDGSRGQYHVETPAGLLLCTIRGRLRKHLVYPTSASGRKSVQKIQVKDHDPVAVGDHVRVRVTGARTGVVEEVLARAGGAITRDDPHPGHGTLRSVAGIDQMIAVFAARDPVPHLRMLDRFLALAEAQELAALVCINKADLGIEPWLAERLAVYRVIGYPVLETSAATGAGLAELRAHLGGRTSAFVGPSGVGKSSLLNAVQPELGLRVSTVSGSTGKGRHTTTGARLVPLDGPEGGYIADTAGIRALGLGAAVTGRLDWCFRELRPYVSGCHLSDCSHLHEPGCAVRAALAAGTIDRQRYDSYCRLRQSDGGAPDTEHDRD